MRPDRRGGPGMTAYYSAMIYLTCFAMGIMALIVQSSD